MKPTFEFGKESKEMEEARHKVARRNTKRFIGIVALLAVVILFISFRSDIKDVFGSAKGKKGDKTSISNNKKTAGDAQPATAGIRIIERNELPKELLEISGLVYMDGQRFACVQDEKGSVFIYNAADGKVDKEISFAGPGDYEGLALVGETAWVLRSDGTLFEVTTISSSKPSVKEYDTPLSASDNTEGLCYDQKNNRLLVALKEGDSEASGYKGIYAFDLATKQMVAEPVYKINLQDELFAGEQKAKKKGGTFMPSAIVVHPVTGDMYITEGRNAKLLVTDAAGTIKRLYQLDKKDFVQPEGITFSPAGELFISNEGAKVPGNILKVELGTE